MIVGVGIDIVELSELAELIERPRMSARVFTPSERAYCRTKARPLESFAARFAAKEAAFKAVGVGWAKGVAWHDAQVDAQPGSPARIEVRGALARHARAIGAAKFHLSLSHSGGYAIAIVIACADD